MFEYESGTFVPNERLAGHGASAFSIGHMYRLMNLWTEGVQVKQLDKS